MTTKTESELRELDLFIAEHVMGWKLSDMMGLRDGRFAIRGDDTYIADDARGILNIRYFRPSTDPAAAMQVLEKCTEKTDWNPIRLWLAKDWNIDWNTARQPAIHVKAPTLPLAIARFARQLFTP